MYKSYLDLVFFACVHVHILYILFTSIERVLVLSWLVCLLVLFDDHSSDNNGDTLPEAHSVLNVLQGQQSHRVSHCSAEGSVPVQWRAMCLYKGGQPGAYSVLV